MFNSCWVNCFNKIAKQFRVAHVTDKEKDHVCYYNPVRGMDQVVRFGQSRNQTKIKRKDAQAQRNNITVKERASKRANR